MSEEIARIIDSQLSDLTLPCDLRDIRVRMAGAVLECMAEKEAEIARLKSEYQNCSELALAYAKENSDLRARLAEATSDIQDKNKLIEHDTKAILALESQCQKMRDALNSVSNMTMMPIESEEEAESRTRRIHQQELEHVARIVQEAIESPLDLELINRVRATCDQFRDDVLNGRDALEAPCLDNDQTNAVLSQFDYTIGQLLKSLSPAP